MFIVIEGIDCSGKTSVCKKVAEQTGFTFEHEPTFSSEHADSLNFKSLNAFQREFYFMIDRYKHQEVFKKYDNLIFDRYRLTGAVYASIFGHEALPMVHAVYGLPEFKKPDITIFLDMDPLDALHLNELKKNSKDYSYRLTYQKLEELRNGFLEQIERTRYLWSENVVTVKTYYGAFNETVERVKKIILERS